MKPITQMENSISENYEAICQALEDGKERLPYPEEALRKLKQLHRDRENLCRLKKQAEKAVAESKNNRDKEAEKGCRKVVSLCDSLLSRIEFLLRAARKTEVDARKEKCRKVCSAYRSKMGEFADAVFSNPAFFEQEWATPGAPDPRGAVKEKCKRITRQLEAICRMGGENKTALLERYLTKFDEEDLKEYRARLERLSQAQAPKVISDEDKISGYKVIRAEGTAEQFARLYALMAMAGMRCSELEDGMPGPMREILMPEFDSFVCFDLESSGTFGADHDAPAEIIEIGAVRVRNGVITERFSTLVNPGRRIIPRVVKLTGITDDMVKGKPSVAQAIRQFAEFAGDDILIGHNIRSCDIPMIVAAGKKEGIAFENDFFDTYLFAEANREGRDWEGLGLESLSRSFGIEMSDAHRAWCDAEANALLYLKMKEMPGTILPAHQPMPKKKTAPVPNQSQSSGEHKKRRRRRRSHGAKKTGESTVEPSSEA